MNIEGSQPDSRERIVPTVCASHCGGACLLKLHVKNGVITRIETDDGEEPQLRACLKGRAMRQRIHAPDRLLYPLKRVGERGEGKFERISWDEALDKAASEIRRIRDTYGPASIVLQRMSGDIAALHCFGAISRLLNMAGGYTAVWGITSYQQGIYASFATYGTWYASNTRDDLVNAKLIILWGWDPASTIAGTNTCWYLAQAKEAGASIISVDPRYTDTAVTLAHQWIPIRPGTDGAVLLAMAYVMIKEKLYDSDFIAQYTSGFDKFQDYVLGIEDKIPKTPQWAEKISGVGVNAIEEMARKYATIKPAALMAGIAPGRTAYGEQYHRIAMTLATMTGNVGRHGGDAAARAWESIVGGYPYGKDVMAGIVEGVPNPVEEAIPRKKGGVLGYREPRLHSSKLADAILKGKAGGYFTDYKMLYIANCNYLTQWPNVNKVVKALHSLEFILVQEQFMTPTAKFADVILPVNMFVERNDITFGVGSPFIGMMNKAIEPPGEAKSPLTICAELAERLGISNYLTKPEEELLEEAVKDNGVPDYGALKETGTYRLKLTEPYVAFQKQIEDPANNPFRTPSGKIEIYANRWANLNIPGLEPVPAYIETWESRHDPLAKKYPLQLITTHFKRRALSKFDNTPWLKEVQTQAVLINVEDARARNIANGDIVRVFNDRGEMAIRAQVTERIMPGVVDVPHGAWYAPDENGVDKGGCANMLTLDTHSPCGGFAYNTGLVEIQKI